MSYTVLIAGGFKPPHKGHYDMIKFYLDMDDVKEVILFCGDKKRDEYTLEQSEAVFEAYGLLDHPKLTYKRATVRNGKKGAYTNPLADCFDWAEHNDVNVGLGWSSKDAGYQSGFMRYFNGITGVIRPPKFEMKDEISSTEFREALSNGESIAKFLPNHVDESQIIELLKG